MLKKLFFFLCLIFAFNSAQAQIFSRSKRIDEKLVDFEKQINALKKEQEKNSPILQQLSVVQEKFRQHKADTSVSIDDLRNENQILKGEIAFLKRQIELFEDTQKNFFKDAEFRLNEIEREAKKTKSRKNYSKKSTSSPINIPQQSSTSNTSAKDMYDIALDVMQDQKNYTKAISAFENFIKQHSKHNLIANAHYWIGESYFALGKHVQAIKTFDVVSKQFPNSSKKCDAILMQAKGFEALKKENEAKLFYSEVITSCPKSSAAEKAKLKLNS